MNQASPTTSPAGVTPRVLCLTFWTPPELTPQAYAIGKLAPEWLRRGLETVFVTLQRERKWDIDAPLYELPQPPRPPWPWRHVLKGRRRQRYYLDLARRCERIIREHRLNLVFSKANPQASNMVGAMLKARTGIRFVSHFSDPWLDNPLKSFSRTQARRILAQETFVVGQSDRIIFTNQQALDLVMRKYPPRWQAKARVVSHCFDPLAFPPRSPDAAGRFVIGHIGVFYRKRTPQPLFAAVGKFLQEWPDLGRKLVVRLAPGEEYTDYGLGDLQVDIQRYGLQHVVEFVAPVPYDQSLAQMRQSDCLVVIDADLPQSPFLPSKVVDYAGSGSCILGITHPGSPTARFLSQLGYFSFAHGQTDALAKCLADLMDGTIRPRRNEDFLKQFEVASTAARFIECFTDSLDSPGADEE